MNGNTNLADEKIDGLIKSTTVSGTTTGSGNITNILDGSKRLLSVKSLTTDGENAGFIVFPAYFPGTDKWAAHLTGMNGTTPVASKAVELVVYYAD